MSVISLIYTVIIMPLQLLFEVIFSYTQRFTSNPGISIVCLSLVVNILVLPLYNRADALQAKQNEIEKKLAPGVKHIKSVFSGDEKMMLLQTYYRQNNYKPTDVINSSISLLLQIPFFIAAYRFLSDLSLLYGSSLGPIANLGLPDRMLHVGGITINILPILMTAINIISTAVYTYGFPLKSKIKIYVIALVFLVLLYSSPSGLVFYWICNNLFSLAKNIIVKLKDPKRAAFILTSAMGIFTAFYFLLFFSGSYKRKAVALFVCFLLQLPLILSYVKKQPIADRIPKLKKNDTSYGSFVLSGIFLTVLIGGIIPSAVIKASPQEFIEVTLYQNPVWYIVYSTCVAFGVFVIWSGVFYYIADDLWKCIFERLLWIYCGVAVINYMFFGTNLGMMSKTLQYENDFIISNREILINTAAVLITVIVMYLISVGHFKIMKGMLVTGIAALAIMLLFNISGIIKNIGPADSYDYKDEVCFNLSKNGKNVIVFMLDRAIGPFVPYIMNEKPEIREQFDGFTWYSNSVSLGVATNFGVPGLYGGYEYTPVKINKRSDMSLADKHDEALRVMPVIFDDNGWDVTVSDPPYAGYQWIPDVSIYSDHPDIKAFNTEGMFNSDVHMASIESNRRKFCMYGLMKSVPLVFQDTLYFGGYYNLVHRRSEGSASQFRDGVHKADGVNNYFLDAYQVLERLSVLTRIKDDETDSFLLMQNDTTHCPNLLQEPEYEIAEHVDNVEYDLAHDEDRFNVDGRTMKMEDYMDYAHYDVHMASFMQLGKWFDFLRDNDVYDNTRIILVSDHGCFFDQFDELKVIDGKYDAEWATMLLMVKDFNEHGFKSSDEFMTNCDVPSVALKDIIKEPVNPATGNTISDKDKYTDKHYVLFSDKSDILENNGNQFLPADWLSVHDDIWNKNNWELVAENSVFTGE